MTQIPATETGKLHKRAADLLLQNQQVGGTKEARLASLSSLSADVPHEATTRGSKAAHRNWLCRGPGPHKDGLFLHERHQKLALLKENLADPPQGAEWSNPTLGRQPDPTFPALPALTS